MSLHDQGGEEDEHDKQSFISLKMKSCEIACVGSRATKLLSCAL